jgi:hypothetical protein
MSLSAVGRKPLELRLSPATHRIISWISPLDQAILFRALLGHGQIVDKTPHDVLFAPDWELSQRFPHF